MKRELTLHGNAAHPLEKLAQVVRGQMESISQGLSAVEGRGFFDLDTQLAAKEVYDALEKLQTAVVLTAYANGLLTFRSEQGPPTT